MKTPTIKPTIKHARKIVSLVGHGLSSGLGQPKPGEACVEAVVCMALGLPHGSYRVEWIERLQQHALFFIGGDGLVSLLATHHNGHSCACLADRICSGDQERAEAYIVTCGGTACSAPAILYATTGSFLP